MVSIAVGVAPIMVAPRNAKRLSIVLYNASLGGQIISISKQGALGLNPLDIEYVLNPAVGLSFMLDFDGEDIQGEWGGYSSAAGGILVVGETAVRTRG